MTEMDLPSLQLQTDRRTSDTEGSGKKISHFFAPVTLTLKCGFGLGLKIIKSPKMWIIEKCTCSECSILATSMVYLEPKSELEVSITRDDVRLAVDMSHIVVAVTFLSDVCQFHPVPLAVGHSVVTLACPCLHDESLGVNGSVGYGKHHLNNGSITAAAVVAVVAFLMVLLPLVGCAMFSVPLDTF